MALLPVSKDVLETSLYVPQVAYRCAFVFREAWVGSLFGLHRPVRPKSDTAVTSPRQNLPHFVYYSDLAVIRTERPAPARIRAVVNCIAC
jgi:hypothetical protein